MILSFNEFIKESNQKYPQLKDLRRLLRYNIIHQFKKHIIKAYIVGSETKGTATASSDIDIAVVFEPIKGKTAIQYTEQYHNHFNDEHFTPKWNNRKLDIQFFYPEDKELETYSKIELL
jgi:predicted nucleotidyltransferase